MNESSPSAGRSVERAADAIRDLIRSGETVPGQQLRQETLAERIGMSRAPVREALQTLLAEGIVQHVPNVGFSVTRLSGDELAEIYLMRRLLEEQLLLGIDEVPPGTADRLVELNEEMRETIERHDHLTLHRLNTDFHFLIFGLSSRTVIGREVVRLWTLSQPYRTFYVYSDVSCRRILREHEAIAAAVGEGETKTLVKLTNKHRRAAETEVAGLLAPRVPSPTPVGG